MMKALRRARSTRTRPSRAIALCLTLVGASLPLYDAHAQPASASAPTPARRPQAQRRFYPLFEAIAEDRVADVRRRLPSRAQINDIDTTSGATPLTWTLIATAPPNAAHMEILRMLLDRGADPNARDGSGKTPMEAAVAYPWPEVLRLLVERGGDLHSAATVGETTLLYSVCQANGRDWPGRLEQRLEVGRILIDAGVDPAEMSPWAQSHGLTAVDECVKYDMPDIARLFVEHGGRPQMTLTHPVPHRAALARELSERANALAGGAAPIQGAPAAPGSGPTP